MNQATTLKQFLIATRWIVEHLGWHQGNLYLNAEGKRISVDDPTIRSACLYGSMMLVEAPSGIRGSAAMFLEQLLLATPISAWNDAQDRTKQDVLNLLDEAISRAGDA